MKYMLPHICFLGCGKIAGRHARLLKKLYPKISLSFASREVKKAEELKRKFKGVHAFSVYEGAIASKDIDIVFITTPHAFHSELAVKAAKAKKDIIIEKPVTRTLEELEEIRKAVEANNVRCVVAENYYFKPFIKKIRSYIDEGLIGKVLFIELNKTNKENITGWRTDAEMMGGGALLEGGVHWVNALVSLAASEPKKVIALRPDVERETNIPFEDSIIVNVEFANGAVGKLTHSWAIPNRLKGLGLSKIYGTEGVITFESNGLFASVHGKKRRFYLASPFKFLGFKDMIRSFVERYRRGKAWRPSMERITVEMRLIHAAYKSLESGRKEVI